MDRSFHGLLFSIIIHGLILWALLTLKLPSVVHESPTEITLIENDDSPKKARKIVTETDEKEAILDRLKDQADYLSKVTKRAKTQTTVRESGPTVNRAQGLNLKPQPNKVAGNTMDLSPDETSPLMPAVGPKIHHVAIGTSTSAEYIPGIKEGSMTFLNSDQFTYYSFFSRVGEQVRNRWVTRMRTAMSSFSEEERNRLSKQNRTTLIEVVLSQKGDYVRHTIHQSASNIELDRAVYEAFRMAAPFLNPPRGLVESDGFIHLYAQYQLIFHPTFGPGTY